MIELNITKSPDDEIVGIFSSRKKIIYIGSSLKNDLIIDDPDISKIHLRMELTEDGILCSNHGNTPFFHSNGKKISGKKNHQTNDTIRIGNTCLEITNLLFTPKPNNRKILEQKYDEITTKMPVTSVILKELEKELVELHKIQNKIINREK